ncbi:hypothetical protein MWH25_03060 [Natroniella acetigena]|uniref:hypothetical protein n=1 Tax=Natroniella acetigena TaxID=52004 RepID=UPI00200A9284|nr:hypothetical protein [Natroniella acetigena]MCK8826723.1 hypothetical protein [Natroniella acetigena]
MIGLNLAESTKKQKGGVTMAEETTEQQRRRPPKRRPKKKDFVKVLKRLAKCNKPVTIIIRSGANCCELTGCIGEVTDEFVVLIASNNVCIRKYIRTDCICAVIEPTEVDKGKRRRRKKRSTSLEDED